MKKLEILIRNLIHNKYIARILFTSGILLTVSLVVYEIHALMSIKQTESFTQIFSYMYFGISLVWVSHDHLKLRKKYFHSPIDLHKKYIGEADRVLELLGNRTQSINYLKIDKKIPIENLLIKIVDRKYSLPWFISHNAADLLMKSDPSTAYNGVVLRTNSIDKISRDILQFNFSYSCYYDYIVTNWSRDEKIFHGLSVRSALEPGPLLNPLEASFAENHLGLSSLFITSDGWVPLFLRSEMTADFSGQLSPSISGASNVDTFSDDELNLSFKNWFEHEMHEEVSGALNLNQFSSIDLVGVSRELIRLGKPEVFFIAHINMTKKELEGVNFRDRKKSTPIKWWNLRPVANPAELNFSENVSHLWINLNDFLFEGGYQLKSHDGLLSICIDNERYVLSESLSANLAFAELLGVPPGRD